MYDSKSEMIADVIYRYSREIRENIYFSVPAALASIVLIFSVSSWWAYYAGIISGSYAFLVIVITFILAREVKIFKKYAPFYNRGDVFLSQIAAQTNLPIYKIKVELEQLIKDVSLEPLRFLERIVIYEETGQIIIASSISKEQAERFSKYIPFYNKEGISSIYIESQTNLPAFVIRKQLQELVDFGAIKPPIIDDVNGTFFIPTIDPKEIQTQAKNEAIDMLLKEGEKAVAEFYRLRGLILDTQMQRKIDEIITLTDAIFKRLSGYPNSYSQVRRFADYYLSKALEFLKAYEGFKNSSVQGENISSMLEQINTAVDLLIAGFNRNHDSLYKHQAFDIEADIKVLEMMLEKDGV